MSRGLSTTLRLAFYVAVLALAAVRWRLNPPLQPLLASLLALWLVTASLFFWLRPRGTPPAPLLLLLDYGFFLYEVTAIVLATHLLGGTGWLTLLLLLYPTIELSRRYPGSPGLAASLLATAACIGVVLLEAVQRLPHDPFYSVGDPLYREPLYVVALLVVALVFLVGIPALIGHTATQKGERGPR